jgi:hypothetical protein
MNCPVKHHFNPAFSLQPWTGSDGLLCEMRRINGRVRSRAASGSRSAEGRPDLRPRSKEYFVRTRATNMIAEIINNARVGPTIFDMHWSRIDLSSSNVTLLNSDRPAMAARVTERLWEIGDIVNV